jgi:phosphoribosylaminoimidazolecarboxamide formyltransferase/IMP cyclohydrolase
MAVRRALISVFDKTGLDRFAAGLAELGVELVASGGNGRLHLGARPLRSPLSTR